MLSILINSNHIHSIYKYIIQRNNSNDNKTENVGVDSGLTVTMSRKEVGRRLFSNKKYDKFKITSVDDDGLPHRDTHGNKFHTKIVGRFKRDLDRELLTNLNDKQ